MLPARATTRRSPSLRESWNRRTVVFLTMLSAAALLCLGVIQYQHVSFETTTEELHEEVAALADLDEALLGMGGDAAIGMLYGIGGPEALDDHRARYGEVRASVIDAFDEVGRSIDAPGEEATVARMRERWEAMDGFVRAGPDNLPAVTAAAQRDEEYYATRMWDRFEMIKRDLVALEERRVDAARERTASVSTVQDVLAGGVVVALLGAILYSLWSVRQMSRLLLHPLLELRRAATAFDARGTDTHVELPEAYSELQELAATLNESTRAARAVRSELEREASTDTLTGLPNRSAFINRVATRLGDARRTAVLFVDLDDFKVVNDSLGHSAGDELLQVVARRLESAAHDCDLVARLGGDEFAVVLDGGDHPRRATDVAQRILARVGQRARVEGVHVDVACSIGIAVNGGDTAADATDELLANADFAMYMAKGHGKNGFEVFAPALHTALQAHTQLKRDLARAVHFDQLELHYQPVVDLASEEVLGFEALVRWQHPVRGLLGPAEFVPLAEDTGDIVEIGNWVIEQACSDLAQGRLGGDGHEALWVSVNVSPSQLGAGSLVGTVRGALARQRLEPGQLVVEITEGAAITNTAAARDVLVELRRHGVRIALDDFGAGFSSLRYLQELPIDTVKIDRAFVANADPTSEAMLHSIVTLCSKLGVGIVLEGIEEAAELERLRGFGRLAGQGFLFAHPAPVHQLTGPSRPRSPTGASS